MKQRRTDNEPDRHYRSDEPAGDRDEGAEDRFEVQHIPSDLLHGFFRLAGAFRCKNGKNDHPCDRHC